ncbi:MAG TPA: hypothetical protein VM940_15145 [Chthoniobacterales bacterium]|jgi:hypothetical protein|nr:hypothetical protein [Chthoniobacterales bacterium]
MRPLFVFVAVLLAGCSTYTSIVGPYRASLSPRDVRAITQIAQGIYPGHYNQMTLNAVGRDEVWVDALSHAATGSYGYVAVRRHGIWKRGAIQTSARYTPLAIRD